MIITLKSYIMPITPEITALESSCLSAKNTGLGNCLFQIASVYGISKICNVEAYYDNLVALCEKLQKLYGLNHKETIYRNFLKVGNHNYSNIKDSMWRRYDSTLIKNIRDNKDTNFVIRGYLEYPGYFIEYKK